MNLVMVKPVRANIPLWVMIEEDAERLRRMSRSMRSPHRAAILVLGYQALRDLSDYIVRGFVPRELVIRLESLERLFKLHGLPSGIISRHLRHALRIRENAGIRLGEWFAGDPVSVGV